MNLNYTTGSIIIGVESEQNHKSLVSQWCKITTHYKYNSFGGWLGNKTQNNISLSSNIKKYIFDGRTQPYALNYQP